MFTLANGTELSSDASAREVFHAMDANGPALVVRSNGDTIDLYLGSFDQWAQDKRRGMPAYDDGQAFARPVTDAERDAIRDQAGYAAMDGRNAEHIAAIMGFELSGRGEWIDIVSDPSDRSEPIFV